MGQAAGIPQQSGIPAAEGRKSQCLAPAVERRIRHNTPPGLASWLPRGVMPITLVVAEGENWGRAVNYGNTAMTRVVSSANWA